MDKITSFFTIGSLLLIVIGTVMILRKAYIENIWWGVGCTLLPIFLPLYVVVRWREAKYGVFVFTLGVVFYGGLVFAAKRMADRAISQIMIDKITITTGLDEGQSPVNDLTRISFSEKMVYIHVKMHVPPKNIYIFAGKLYDAKGKLVFNYRGPMVPKESVWNTWFYHDLDRTSYAPGQWHFEIMANNIKLAEHSFDVIEE